MTTYSSRKSLALVVGFIKWFIKGRKSLLKDEISDMEDYLSNQLNLLVILIVFLLVIIGIYVLIELCVCN